MTDEIRLDAAAVRWSAEPHERAGRPLLVLLHGYGADEADLWGLVPHLPGDFVVAAVRAPLLPPWPAPGYSWYPIEGLEGRSSQSITTAATAFLDWLAEAAGGDERVGLLGFSQGAAVALQALRLAPVRFAFAVNLSGYVAPEPLAGDDALAERRPPVFWGRGTDDTVIPSALVAHTVQWLPSRVELSGRVYDGLAHAVSAAELADVRTFLQARLSDEA